MAQEPPKRLSPVQVVLLLALPFVGLLFIVGVVAVGWSYLGRRDHDGQTQASASASASAPAMMDKSAAVAALRGNGTPELKAMALSSLENLAAGGDSKAMVMVAASYRVGLAMARDDQLRAFEWYRKAAQAGEPSAMLEMARYYKDGVWVEANPSESKQWLERAAKTGSVEAKWQLGMEAR